MSGGERRREARLPKSYRLDVAEFAFPLGSSPMREATCVDVSAGGLAVLVDHRFVVGDQVLVRLHIARLNRFRQGFFKAHESDGEQILQAVAEVVRVDQDASLRYCLGLRFTNVYEDDWQALRGLIEHEIRRMDNSRPCGDAEHAGRPADGVEE
jgi:c-di-GMP-binding flagellar brake protein YcgR